MEPLFGPRLAICVALIGLLVGAPKAVGAMWSLRPTHNRQPDTILFDVSCPLVRSCLTVGHSDPAPQSDPQSTAVVERWNGATFRALSPPVGPAGTGALAAVSCPVGHSCEAVGYDTNGALAESWTSGGAAIQNTPADAGELTSVSCATVNDCMAVGSATSPGSVTIRWDGSTWSDRATADHAHELLTAVSCPSARSCLAVGEGTIRRDGVLTGSGVAERWNRARWRVVRMPKPRAADRIYLKGISCTSSRACTAVGYYTTHSRRHRFSFERVAGLAERWNGRRWTVQRLASRGPGRYTELFGVSCPSLTKCTAVGNYSTGHHRRWTLAERWNGRRWRVQATPNADQAFKSLLLSVSCPTVEVCMAVGYSAMGTPESQTHRLLVERWF